MKNKFTEKSQWESKIVLLCVFMNKSEFHLLAIVGGFDTAHTLSRNRQALVKKNLSM